MGNCLSKIREELQILCLRHSFFSSILQIGANTQIKAASMGFHPVREIKILTPVADRFPPCAAVVEMQRLEGVRNAEKLRVSSVRKTVTKKNGKLSKV